ncbi:hypothetical protein AB6A40_008030 [Gnathostoma spinigerum]|uniref:Uncharacterized protein n=1 Tax=Gnathostoma spinigerum TaxID=75299 RepID=A0ABD6ENF0_9BILA
MTTASISIDELRRLVNGDEEYIERIEYWYNTLSVIKLDGTETSDYIESLVEALKFIMQYEHLAVEEVKAITEKEAADAAEKEAKWEEKMRSAQKEINELRDKLTSRVTGGGELTDTFRAQIESLREENNRLKTQNRDQNREIGRLRDLSEELTTKVDQMERERSALINQQTRLENDIRELQHRLSSAKEITAKSEWESRKLAERSEQAAQLAMQLRDVTEQNENLKLEVESLSTALASATKLIGETAETYSALKEKMDLNERTIKDLMEDNQLLSQRVEEGTEKAEKLEDTTGQIETRWQEIVDDKDSQIEKMQAELKALQMELEETRAKMRLDANEKDELEELRNELINATRTARELFGKIDGDTTDGEIRLKVLEQSKVCSMLFPSIFNLVFVFVQTPTTDKVQYSMKTEVDDVTVSVGSLSNILMYFCSPLFSHLFVGQTNSVD